MVERAKHWAEIGAFFAGALLGGAVVAGVMPHPEPAPEVARPIGPGPACPVMADLVVWGHIDPQDVPEGGVDGFLLAVPEPDGPRAAGMGIWLKPGSLEARQR